MKNITLLLTSILFSVCLHAQVEIYAGGGPSIGFYYSKQLNNIFDYYNHSKLRDVHDELELPVALKGVNLHYVATEDFSFGYGLEFLRGKESGSSTDSLLETNSFDLRFTEINFQYILGYGISTEEMLSVYLGGELALGLQSIGKKDLDIPSVEYQQIYFTGNYGLGVFAEGIFKLTDWLCVSARPYLTFYLQLDDFASLAYEITDDYDIPSDISYQGYGVKRTFGIDLILAYAEY